MCGRYTIAAHAEQLAERFGAALPSEMLLQPRYNAAPLQMLPVVLQDDGRRVALFRWGLMPRWAKDPSIANKLINARAETLEEKPSFRDALRRRRCLVPADGFYEWQKLPEGKIPMRMTLRSGELFAMAGLWESWKDPATGELLHTFTIITTSPNELMSPIHNRMPAILAPEHEALWLDQSAGPEVWRDLLRPCPAEILRAYPVSSQVNNPRVDHPSLIDAL
ncbi:MAG: DUF159 family protein [Herpetosiphonaceae bacterium]|nr:MAG: DUF159 family protein [Herpetosiphonaceae bacterium]